ncbi:MAG: anti-sigma factor antagonist [Acidobacteria bacterium]|nr:anti-sigma factor antagonist [Acidobacteriota bacterium]NIM63672.1 anti-sigma factor antagonist [Acidobacteriota bacterium]NIO59275.1 anti-sigma factor antagonist [Acidobacteriota bacterium]NIQ30287.1 anti-sigma factor antagonist [Acidobacteriota bacterium]NIQ85230.1 anti-sigma factor antagonist [Acidobacteriota bacterium]
MQARVIHYGEVAVLSFEAGEVLDSYVASDVKAQAFRRLDRRADLVIDLGNLEFVDSAGLGVLVGIYKRIQQCGQRVAVARAQPYVARVMRIIKLDRVFESFEDVPAALAAFSPTGAIDAAGTRTRE